MGERSGLPFERLRRLTLSATLLVSAGFLLALFNQFYPVKDWLFWVYLRVWLGAIAFGASCLCSGHWILTRISRSVLPLVEHVAFAFGLGLFAFYLLVFGAGILGLLRPWFFFVAPAALIALGARSVLRFGKRLRRHLFAAPRRLRFSVSARGYVLGLAGIFGLAALYFPILTPDNVAYDVRWYHLPLAENYVALGAVRRSAEGWLPAAYPHLLSYLYTWAQLLPRANYFEKVELCQHLEFIAFLGTMPGIVALAHRLVPRSRAYSAWVATFLFPGIFCYDSGLIGGADHVAALFGPLVLIALFRMLKEVERAPAALLGICMAGAVSTKFTAIIVVLFPIGAALVWWLARTLLPAPGKPRSAATWAVVTVGVAGLAASSPHWLKNIVWYGDPLYPTLRGVLRVHPMTPDFAVPFEEWFYPQAYRATHDAAGLKASLKAMFSYSFFPNDWWLTHHDWPIFGSLSTLSLGCLPFLRGTKRIWFVHGVLLCGVFAWYRIHHFDRYLQTLMPLMAAALAATLVLLWKEGVWVRVPLCLLVATQAIWGLDVYFFPTHQMAGSVLKRTLDLLSSGFSKDYENRYNTSFHPFHDLGKDLPKTAVVLVHESHMHWGLERASISDWQGTQAGISYGRLRGIRSTYELLKGLGVTHLTWENQNSKGYDTLAGDFNFFGLVHFGLKAERSYGSNYVAPLPKAPPPDWSSRQVLYMGCADRYQNGVYGLNQLVISDFDPQKRYPKPGHRLGRIVPEADLDELLGNAGMAVIDPACYSQLGQQVERAGLVHLARRGRLELYAKPPVLPS